ncbi:palmitoyltransferase Pfa3p [[Candida] anglica]|uniref:Palmitoyltransferase n=1 Tax=[Candida] anglica TaxID=148631 RepID=A0ABP0E5C0_9ASCO
MLISHPRIMYQTWMTSLESVCCALASLFPKFFCSILLTWSYYVFMMEAVYNGLVISRNKSVLAYTASIVATVLYGLCLYTYFKVVVAGPGSPLDFEELRINNIDSLANRRRSENPFDTNTTPTTLDQTNESETHLLAEEMNTQAPEVPPLDYVKMYTVKQKRSAPVAYRYCLKCSCWKPDRCHHCSSCKKCVLRMDHHCPWFASCIGFYNQKFFIQFLTYLAIYSGLVFVVTTSLLWKFFTQEMYKDGEYLSLSLVFLFVVSLSFFFAVSGFAIFTSYLVVVNTTTIEVQESKWNVKRNGKSNGAFQYEFDQSGGNSGENGSKKSISSNIFDLGYKRNWTSIMGETWIEWLLPINSTSDKLEDEYKNGINFEINHEAYQQWVHDTQLQDQLNQQVEDYVKRTRAERESYV